MSEYQEYERLKDRLDSSATGYENAVKAIIEMLGI